MADYVLLLNFTKQGLEKIKDSPTRYKAWQKMVEQAGAKIKAHYVVFGQYDAVEILEAPNDETVAKLSLQLGSLGNIRAQTLRAFTQDQFVEMVK